MAFRSPEVLIKLSFMGKRIVARFRGQSIVQHPRAQKTRFFAFAAANATCQL